MQKPIREKLHRLPITAYQGFVAVAFTANIKDRKQIFINIEIFNDFQSILLKELEHQHCSSHVFLFMPDHLHLIISGEEENANAKKCMDMFKQRTGFWLSKHIPEIRWQKDYYDHIIRSDEELSRQIRYILLNPVRAGLTDLWKSYPYKGSLKFKLEEWENEL